MSNNHGKRAGEIRVTLELNGETHHFNAHTTTTTLKEDDLTVVARENAFSPFRMYTVDLRIKNGTPPGRYLLDGDPNNKVRVFYLPPHLNILSYYVDISGHFNLTETATEQRIVGSFDCVAKSVDPAITAEATLSHGIVSFDQQPQRLSKGSLKGELQPGNIEFVATDVSMEFVGGTGAGSFLQVIAKVKEFPEHQIHLHIPRALLGEPELPITLNEDGKSALATLVYTGVHRADKGTVIYHYDSASERITGTLEFEANDDITFKKGKFEITGLIPQR